MLDFLIDNMFVEFGRRAFQQTIGMPMGTNCAPLLADLFFYSYEADFVQELMKTGKQKKKKKKKKRLSQQFNLKQKLMF